MQGLQRYANDVVSLDLSPPSSSLAVETTEEKIQRLITEHPVIIFSRTSCCMCHVMKNLVGSIGVHPTVIELDEHEISTLDSSSYIFPSLFVGGSSLGGLESLVALHLSGHLLPKLLQAGAFSP